MPEIEARSYFVRTPLHATITVQQISDLVDKFYGSVRSSALLGPIFSTHIDENWDKHLPKMKAFWRSVLLKTAEYKGKPVPVHLQIEGLDTEEFEEWLRPFCPVVDEIFDPEAAVLVKETAQKIAQSLWLSRLKDPYATPPVWLHAVVEVSPTNSTRLELRERNEEDF